MTESDLVEAPGYKVKRVEPVIKGSDVQARVFTLLPARQFPGTITDKVRIITLFLKGWFRSPPASRR